MSKTNTTGQALRNRLSTLRSAASGLALGAGLARLLAQIDAWNASGKN